MAEFARATHDHSGRVPPTFTAVASHYAPEGQSPNEQVIKMAGLDPSRVLLGSSRWEFRRELVVGDLLMGTVEHCGTDDREGRRGGRLRLAHGRTTWVDSRGKVAVIVEATLIETDRGSSGSCNELIEPDHSIPSEGPTLELSVTDIVRYAGASGDFNPMHHDQEIARRRGYAGVFAMGMLPGGIMASALSARVWPAQITGLELRFRGIFWPGVTYRIEEFGSTTTPGRRLLAGDGHEVMSIVTVLGPERLLWAL